MSISFNINELLTLYINRQYNILSKKFIDILSYLGKKNYDNLTPNIEAFINNFIETFLHIFIQPDYTIYPPYSYIFIELNHVISNLVAITPYQNTDQHLKFLSSSSNDIVKILTLYSARNNVSFDVKNLFDRDPNLASLWYFNYFFLDSYPTLIMNKNINNHIKNLDPRLKLPSPSNIHFAYFLCSYYSKNYDKPLKQKINELVKETLKNIKITNKPNKKKIGIVTDLWINESVIHRSLYKVIKLLKTEYELTLININELKQEVDKDFFDEVINIDFPTLPYPSFVKEFDNYITKLKKNLNVLVNNEFSLILFLNIGLTSGSIYLSNLRIAPIQVSCYGHPVSTYSTCIDYFIGSSQVELPNSQSRYSEKLLLLPDIGLYHSYKSIEKFLTEPNKNSKFIINCPWSVYKFNYNNLMVLKKILERANKPIKLRFYTSFIDRYQRTISFKKEIKQILEHEDIEYIYNNPYHEYINILNEGDLNLFPFIFCGYNTVIDCLLLKKILIILEGKRASERLSYALLKELNLDELIAKNKKEYINKVCKIINNDTYRLELSSKLKNIQIKEQLFNIEPINFKRLIDKLIKNSN